jgi:hypothetical protein
MALKLSAVMSRVLKWSVNSNPVYSHSYTWQYYHNIRLHALGKTIKTSI